MAPCRGCGDATIPRIFRDRVERVLEAMPDAGIGTDIIAGFPGETELDFERSFSVHRGAAAFVLSMCFHTRCARGPPRQSCPARLPPAEIKRRSARLRELGERKREAFAQRFVGKRLKVLLEESTEDGELGGYSRNYVRVLTRGAASQLNRELEVEASFAKGAQLVGEIVAVREAAGPRAAAGVS